MSIRIAYKVLPADNSYALELELNHWAREGWLLDQTAGNLLILVKTFVVDDDSAAGREPATPDAPPEPAPVTDRAAILQRDRAQAAAAEAQNGATWETARTRARLEAALCDVVDGLAAASQVRGIRSFAEVFSAEEMIATRNLILSALAALDKTRPHLEDLIAKLDTMIETGKPYED